MESFPGKPGKLFDLPRFANLKLPCFVCLQKHNSPAANTVKTHRFKRGKSPVLIGEKTVSPQKTRFPRKGGAGNGTFTLLAALHHKRTERVALPV
jgi:hypothetical protein